MDEIACRQAETDKQSRLYGPGIYLRRLLDALTAFFLVTFTKKPLRLFGLVGSSVFAVGFVVQWLGRDASPICDEDSVFQLHALWHVLAAWGTALLYRYLFVTAAMTPSSPAPPGHGT